MFHVFYELQASITPEGSGPHGTNFKRTVLVGTGGIHSTCGVCPTRSMIVKLQRTMVNFALVWVVLL